MSQPLQTQIDRQPGSTVLRLTGDLDDAAPSQLERATSGLPAGAEGRLIIDLTGVRRLGAAGVVLLGSLTDELTGRGWDVRLKAASSDQVAIIRTYGGATAHRRGKPPASEDLVDIIGLRTIHVRDAGLRYVAELRQALTQATLQLVRGPWRRLDETLVGIVRIGIGAAPLVALISFLIGFILALQAAPLLRQFGQSIRVADLVGVSITREIGPLLTAILVAGRSGSSLTAELGTMKVSEELSALEAMGIQPVGYLIAPRVRAMMIALPLLTVMADVVGIVGGMVVGMTALDISINAYLDETISAVKVRDALGGLVKALYFGIVIVSVAAHQGLATTGGSRGVGRFVTRSVVQAIIWIIVVDAVFTTILYFTES